MTKLGKLVTVLKKQFPIVPRTDKAYKRPFRQYKDLSYGVKLNKDVSYHTAIPAVILTYFADLLDLKEEVMDYLCMGVTDQEGENEYNRYVKHFQEISLMVSMKMRRGEKLNDGEKAWVRKVKMCGTAVQNELDIDSIFRYD